MENIFSRTEMLFDKDKMETLKSARVAVFGIGGVGGYAAEALARCGIGTIDIIDNDDVSITNINRQIIALHSTIGRAKTEVMAERIRDINPDATVNIHNCFYTPETSGNFDFGKYDYIIDAIDTVAGKIELVVQAQACGTPIICSMGTGNKTDPTAFCVTDIYKTSECPLARVMRYELRKRGIKNLKVVYSNEKPIVPAKNAECGDNHRRSVPGSIAFVPPVAGLIAAAEVVKDLISKENSNGESA